MITRRMLVLTSAAELFAASVIPPALAAPAVADDPLAIVNAIYARAAKGKGDGGGTFIIDSKAAKAKYLSRSLVALWAKSDARIAKGDSGPVAFDPVTNSQDPDLKSFKAIAEKLEPEKATIAVTITGRNARRPKPADRVVRYDFVRDTGQWKIDDIRGAVDGEPWSIRKLLTFSLKN
jgi:hypothetical protein